MKWRRFKAYFTGAGWPTFEGHRGHLRYSLHSGRITEAEFNRLNAGLVALETGEGTVAEMIALEKEVFPERYAVSA